MNEPFKFSHPNFFEIHKQLSITKPYHFQNALNAINSYTDNFIKSEFEFIIDKEVIERDVQKEFNISSMKFLTSKLSADSNLNLVQLENMENYLTTNPEIDEKITLKMINNDNRKSILIKSLVDYCHFTSNIYNNLCEKSQFKSGQNTKKMIDNKIQNDQHLYFDIEIPSNSINKVYYSSKNEFLFDLQFPPFFKTNFMKDNNTSEGVKQKEYENIIFPFRNFNDETSNLKYRRMFILISYTDNPSNTNNDNNDINDEDQYTTKSNLLYSLLTLIDKKKVKHAYSEMFNNIYNENKMKNKFKFKYPQWEISDYFNYNKHPEIKDIFLKNNFIDINSDNPQLQNLNVIKFYYLILALISENIISYYNAIEFIENLLFLNNNDNNKLINFTATTPDEFPLIFTEALNKMLDSYQNMGNEFSLQEFIIHLEEKFNFVYTTYQTKGMNYIIKPSRNKSLIRIQRIIVTPTYILFTPYVLDQGNRILRNFIAHPFLAMICVFKLDDFNEGRWNNKFLIEYIKFILSNGIILGINKYTFFDFSQSQFRNMSCWLLTEPEKVLPLTGDYSKINIVAKFGARLSQTLTTTKKTILIPESNIKYIDEIEIKDNNGRTQYTFSDGVGKISYVLAQRISELIHLKFVPSAFQGRFLGCKGVWTTIYDDFSENIYIRPSQKKFDVKITNEQYFELCDYSRYIQAYLNRQVILLLSSLGISDDIFMKKLEEYRQSLEDEKFVLSLVHYEEWNGMFNEMYLKGVNMNNDRLIKALVDNNKDLLYNDLKKKARIYIKDSAYVIGIMDEYGILEYGEAFLHIKKRDLDLILDQKCSVAKCPCLHPGDIRVLNFRKFNINQPETEKYKIFERYTNVLIFPQKGHRPHPNELSGSDLDGDNYFVFYDNDLIPDHTVDPMNYNLNPNKIKSKNKPIKLKNVIKYFAEYINLNNLGLIGDAHLALSDCDKKGADGRIPRQIAEKFSRAVDAPKTGDKVFLSEEETPKKFPHYMEKKKNSYISEMILGQLYDKIEQYKIELSQHNKKDNSFNNKKYYDSDIENTNWVKFGFIAIIFYKEYFEEFVSLLKKNEIKSESVLLTGNNVDNEESVFSKKKHNYDLREKVASQMVEIFKKFNSRFYNFIKYIFNKCGCDDLLELNNELFIRNNYHLYAIACYMISYNFQSFIDKGKDMIEQFKNEFINEIINCYYSNDNEGYDIEMITQYQIESFGIYDANINEEVYDDINERKQSIIKTVETVISNFAKSLNCFHRNCERSCKLPKNSFEENQYRILSFPWCVSGKLLSKLKYLNNIHI